MTISSGHASIHIREFPQTDNDSESSVFGLFDVDAYCCDFSYDFGPNRRSVFLCPLDSENSSQDEKHLNRICQSLDPERKHLHIKPNFTKQTIDISYVPRNISLSRIIKTLSDEGFRPVPDRTIKQSKRHDLMRIGLSAFSFLNIMLFSSAEYLSGTEKLGYGFDQFFG